jgi:hypothetical protein
MLRRFKRCSQATGVQDPNVGMLVILMMNCLWTVPYNVPAIMFDCNISDNFLYAIDLVQSCHVRQTPAVVLKLDFKKAFDCVN